MWTLEDYTTKTGGYLQIQKDGKRVADVFPFAKASDSMWVRRQAMLIVKTMNDAELKGGSK